MDFKFGVRRCQYSGNDPSFVPKPGLSVHGTRLFLACLSLDLDLMTAIVSGIRDIFKINIQLDAGFVGIAQRGSRCDSPRLNRVCRHTIWSLAGVSIQCCYCIDRFVSP